MDIEILGLLGLALTATGLATIVYQRRMGRLVRARYTEPRRRTRRPLDEAILESGIFGHRSSSGIGKPKNALSYP